MRISRRTGWISGALAAAWLITGMWLVPHLIREAYAGRSLPLLNSIIGARSAHPVEFYQTAWTRLFWIGTGALVLLAALYALIPWRRAAASVVRALRRAVEQRLPIRQGVLVACAIGILTGFVEAALQYSITLLTHQPMMGGVPRNRYTADILWMAPLANLFAFMLIAALIAVPHRIMRRQIPVLPFVMVITAISCYAVTRSLRTGAHPLALFGLSVGIALQVARWTAPTQRTLVRYARNVLIIGVLSCIVIAASAARSGRTTSWEKPSESARNVLLIVLDTQRARNLSIYGYNRRTTRNIDGLAKDAVVFDRAIATAPWTLPSHASIFTGRWPSELSANWNMRLDDEYPTLAELFTESGYATGAFVANEIYANGRSGLDRGFQVYHGDPRSPVVVFQNAWITRRITSLVLGEGDHGVGRKRAENVRIEFMRWLDQTGGRPFFAFLNFMDTHSPYLATTPYDTMFGGKRIKPRPQFDQRFNAREVRGFLDAYDQALTNTDAEIGKLLDALRTRGVLDRTIIVITSDHGEQLGERRLDELLHGETLYLAALHVPLIVRVPGEPGMGTRVTHEVSLRDIAATIVDLAKIQNPQRIPGTTLSTTWRDGTSSGVSPALSQLTRRRGPVEQWPHSAVAGRYHYIVQRGAEQLYDINLDPWERRNLADSLHRKVMTDLAAQMWSLPKRKP